MFVIVGGRSLLPGGGNGGGCGVNLPLPYVGAAAADSAWNCQFDYIMETPLKKPMRIHQA